MKYHVKGQKEDSKRDQGGVSISLIADMMGTAANEGDYRLFAILGLIGAVSSLGLGTVVLLVVGGLITGVTLGVLLLPITVMVGGFAIVTITAYYLGASPEFSIASGLATSFIGYILVSTMDVSILSATGTASATGTDGLKEQLITMSPEPATVLSIVIVIIAAVAFLDLYYERK